MEKKNLDIDLIERCKQKEELAFEELYECYKKNVYFIAYNFFGNRHTAEDIVQDTFIIVYKNIQNLKEPKAFVSWLYKIAYSCCCKKARRKKLSINFDDENHTIEDYSDECENSPVALMENKRFWEVLSKEIQKFSISMKSVCILRYYENLSMNEIAEILDLPLGTVKSQLSRSRKLLSISLEKEGLTPNTFGTTSYYSVMGAVFPLMYTEMFDKVGVSANISMKLSQIISKKKWSYKAAIAGFSATAVVTGSILLSNLNFSEKSIRNVDKVEKISIKQIHYNENFTNQNIKLDVLCDGDYDFFTINDIRTDTIENNGIYKIKIFLSDALQDEKEIQVNNIDIEAPMQVNFTKMDNQYTIFYKDNLSGIDRESIEFLVNGIKNYDYYFDENNNAITISTIANQVYEIKIKDKAGNEANTISH